MLEIMLAVRPRWLQLILSGIKDVELRKSRPRTAEPFLVDLYETKSYGGRGAVVGRCLCYCVARVKDLSEMAALQENSCVSTADMLQYSGQRHLCAWYLADIEQFSAQRLLSEYGISRAPQSWCYVKEGAK